MPDNNISDDLKNLLNGKYGTALLIVVALVLIWLFIKIIPQLVWASLVLIAAFFVFKRLSKK